MLEWNAQFETGHSLIDAQHRMLISYINRLEELSGKANDAREEVELFVRFLEFLEDYILTHFREEENCMYRYRCPAHFDNKKAHTEFLDFFRGLKRRFGLEGYQPDLARELVVGCMAWVQRHILRIDVQLRPCQTPFLHPEQPA